MELGFIVGGREVKRDNSLEVIDYYSNKKFATVSIPKNSDIEIAIKKAKKGFEKTRKMASYEKGSSLKTISKEIKKKKKELAKIISKEAGKPIKYSLVEVDRAIQTFEIAAEEAKRIKGEVLPIDLHKRAKNKIAIIERFPIGIISAITPFNFPLNLVAHKVAPALASGNTIVVKPSERTPVSAIMLGKIVAESGYPMQAISVLPVDRKNASVFVEDERFKMVSFTGSAKVGWMIKSKAGKKRVALELGGNAATIVDETADLKEATNKIVTAAFGYAGQSCISVQRVIIVKEVYEELKNELVKKTKKIVVGNPLNEKTDVGPMINESEAIRIESWVKEAEKEGANILIGGKRKKAVYYPTILENVKPSNKCYSEEAFAPILVLKKVSGFKQAIREVNNSRYGLQGGIFTKNLDRAFLAYREIEAGGVTINEVPTFRVDNYPYGGIKDSGFGREGVKYAIKEMTEPKIGIFEVSGLK